MRSLATLFLIAFASNFALALPSYDEGLRDQALKKALFDVLSDGHISLGYTRARKIMFGQIHLEQSSDGYAVRDVYCQILYSESDFKNSPPGPDKIPDGNIINTEHSWPQSHFSKKFPKDLQKSDLNILFPTNNRANTSRSNLELADVSEEVTSPCTNAKRGFTPHGGRQVYFEPPNEQKGASARAILYFSIRYKLPISDLEEAALKRWHQQYPPTPFEVDRNDQVFQAQHNRNPFIDDPGLVDRISDF